MGDSLRRGPDEVKPGNGDGGLRRRRLLINGTVQGVGMRPFLYRIATELCLAGWVRNDSDGVVLEVEGPSDHVEGLSRRLVEELPPLARIDHLEEQEIPPLGAHDFEIVATEGAGEASVSISPDAATCPECLQDINDPHNPRFRYPFTNCTHCGPRYTITRTLPYDRPQTTMAPFLMCPRCQGEYEDPLDRRFHAQPNACPECGPNYWIEPTPPPGPAGDVLFEAARLLKEGNILALKGIGGFHLACRAREETLVRKLRRRKLREKKPLAVMVPTVEDARGLVELTEQGERLLGDVAAPIVLAPKRLDAEGNEPLAASVAPDSGDYGILIPYTPFHHLLLAAVGEPLVMTSANLSGDAIVIDNDEARERLVDIADYLVLHDREIYLGCDDSVVRIYEQGAVPLRRSRGYAPAPVRVAHEIPTTLALGGILKATVAVTRGDRVHLSQHLGDLDNVSTVEAFHRTVDHLLGLWKLRPELVAYDAHPLSLGFQEHGQWSGVGVAVQHHHAHMASVLAEHQIERPVLGVCLDGTGYGDDGSIWGGEFLLGDAVGYERVGHSPQFRLPGGDGAIRNPWRTAAALLFDLLGPELARFWAAGGDHDFHGARTVLSMLECGVGCTPTTSYGRLYDAVAAILGLCPSAHYEAQAPMLLERTAGSPRRIEGRLEAGAPDYFPRLLRTLLQGMEKGRPIEDLAAWAQDGLAHWAAQKAVRLAREKGVDTVVGSGGCFVNAWLRRALRDACEEAGLRWYTNVQVPAGDGGIALGQAWVAAQRAAAGEVA